MRSTSTPAAADNAAPPIKYPVDRIIAIVDTRQQLRNILLALLGSGFQGHDIATLDARDAERMQATTGHVWPVSWLIRLAQRLGLKDAELEVKKRYEEELRAGRVTVAVRAAEARGRARVIDILQSHGAHFIHSFGRYTIQRVAF